MAFLFDRHVDAAAAIRRDVAWYRYKAMRAWLRAAMRAADRPYYGDADAPARRRGRG